MSEIESRLQNQIHYHPLQIKSDENETDFLALGSPQAKQGFKEEKCQPTSHSGLQIDNNNELQNSYSGQKYPLSKYFDLQKFDKGDLYPEQEDSNSQQSQFFFDQLEQNDDDFDTNSTATSLKVQKIMKQSSQQAAKKQTKNNFRTRQEKVQICKRYIELNKNFKSLKKEYPSIRKIQVQKYLEQDGNRKKGSGRFPDNLEQDSKIFKIFNLLYQRGFFINQTAARLAASIVLRQHKIISKGRKNKWVKNFERIINGEDYYGINSQYLKYMQTAAGWDLKIQSHKLYGKLKLK